MLRPGHAVLLLTLPYSLACSPRSVSAQDASRTGGLLVGTVSDPSGARLPGAVLELNGTATHQEFTSDALGRFTLRLPAGQYELSVRAKGFQPIQRQEVAVAESGQTTLPLTMTIDVLATEINVDPQAGLAHSTAAADNLTAIVLGQKKLQTLSDDQSTFQQQIEAMAIGGDSGTTELFVDGFSGGRFPPKSAIREVRINGNPFSAEYDSLGFGRIEVFTKPGTNKLHGSFQMSGDTQGLNARNPYNLGAQPPYHDLFYEGNLNGPLGRKTSFLFAEERSDSQSSAVINAETLGGDGQITPFSGAVPNPNTENTFSLRLDRGLTPTNVLTGRYEINTNAQLNAGVGQLVLLSQGVSNQSAAQTLQLSDTQTLGAATVVETRFGYVRSRSSQVPNSNAPTLLVQGSFSGGGNPGQASSDHGDRYELQEYISHSAGPNLLRFGGRFRFNRDANTSTGNYNGVFTFPSLLAYQLTVQGQAAAQSFATIRAAGGGPSQFNVTVGQPSAAVSTMDLGIYAEDEWRARKNLTVDAGFRIESQTAIPDHFDPAPRVGVGYAWTPGSRKEPIAVFRAGFGMFYNRFSTGNLLTAVRQSGASQTGEFIANPQFYFTGNPTLDPSLLNPADLSTTQATTVRVSPTLAEPYTLTGSFSVEHGFASDKGVISATWIGTRGVHQFLSRNLNAPLPGTFSPTDPGSGVRPLGGNSNLYQFSSDGIRRGQTLSGSADLNPTKALSVWAFYTLQFRSGDTAGANAFPSNEYNLAADYGRSVTARQRIFTGLWYNAPRRGLGLMGGLFFRANSGTPFNITTGTDLNGDTIFNDRPAFATDLARPSVVRSPYGNFDTAPTAGQTTIPVNSATSPAFYSL